MTSETSSGLPGAALGAVTYTPLNQVNQVGASGYSYDTADNIAVLTGGTNQSFNTANQLCWSSASAGSSSSSWFRRAKP